LIEKDAGHDSSINGERIRAGIVDISKVFKVSPTNIDPSQRFFRDIKMPSWSDFEPYAMIVELEDQLGLHLKDDSAIRLGNLSDLLVRDWIRELARAKFVAE